MATYSYTIQTTRLPAGKLEIILYSSFDALTAPTFPTLIVDEDLTERLDVQPGEIQPEEMEFRYIEDYSTNSQGFWFTALQQEQCDLKLTLTEPITHEPVIFFWGKVQPDSKNIKEYDLKRVGRNGRFRCVSMLYSLTDPFQNAGYLNDWETDLWSRDTADGGGSTFIKLTDSIASMLYVSGLNATFDGDDVVIINGCDFRFYDNAPTGTYGVADLWWCTNFAGPVSTLILNQSSLFAVLGELCRCIQMIPRIYYDLADDRWKIELFTRGSSYTTAATYPVPIESEPIIESDIVARTVLAIDQSGNQGWVLDGVYGTGTFGARVSPDITVNMILGGSVLGSAYMFYVNPTGTTFNQVESSDYYDYVAAAQDTTARIHSYSVSRYLYKRYAKSSRGYTRRYFGLGATVSGVKSTANIKCGMRTQITEGLTTKNFYASEVTKNLVKNSLTVRWVEI